MKITAITPQSKNIDRVNLFLDGKFYSGVSRVAVYNHRLEVGREISEDELAKLIFDSDRDKAFDYALTYIAKYTPTAKTLSSKLYDKGYGKAVVDYTVDKCKKYGYINDAEYAKAYIAFNGNVKGKNRIRSELKAKGIDDGIIEEQLAKMPESDACSRLAQKKSEGLDLSNPKDRAKIIRFLQYRGYEWEDIAQAIATLRVVSDED